MLAEKKLSPYQGLLHAIWTDERISGSCVSIQDDRAASRRCRRRPPLRAAQDSRDRAAPRLPPLAFGPTLCADCDGRCSVAAGTKAELGNLTRFLTYHEHHGIRTERAASTPRSAPKPRDWAGADLEAAREACPNKLNFAKLLPDADRHLA